MQQSEYTRLFSEPFRITEPEFVHRVEVAHARGDHEAECKALIDLAFARIHMGKAVDALGPAADARALATVHHQAALEVEARLWHNCAIHFSNDHETPTSFDSLIHELAEHGLSVYIPIALVVRARELDRTNRRDDSYARIEQALALVKEISDPYVRSFTFRLSGMLLRAHEHFTQAITLF